MSKKLYVGSLAYKIDDQQLQSIFAVIGNVESAKVITEPGGRSKGFGFVEMSTEDEAKKAIHELNGTVHEGRPITVSEARPQTKRTGGGSGDRDRGGRRGDRGDRW
jgi:RNA recognition motif-containing protein